MSNGDANITFDADTEQKLGLPAIDGMPDFKPVITPELAEELSGMEPRDRKFALSLMGTMSIGSQQIAWAVQHIITQNAVIRDLKREQLNKKKDFNAVGVYVLATIFGGLSAAVFMRIFKVL